MTRSGSQETIIFTGGGSAGHVIPNLPLIQVLRDDYRCHYIGSYNGIEKRLVEARDIPYHAIASGKLRRYFSYRHFIDPWLILFGLFQALFLLIRHRPRLVFSKGGFVSAPVVFAAWVLRIPVIIHESDRSPGLANRLAQPFATKIALTFAETRLSAKYRTKSVLTGTPVRPELFTGQPKEACELFGLNDDKPVLFIMGGSLGAKGINEVIWANLDALCQNYQVVHMVGNGNLREGLEEVDDYQQHEYIGEALSHLLAVTSVVISRAGANAIWEFIALQIPHLLIPLGLGASRGDQLENAEYFAEKGVSIFIPQASFTYQALNDKLNLINNKRSIFKEKMSHFHVKGNTEKLQQLITETIKG